MGNNLRVGTEPAEMPFWFLYSQHCATCYEKFGYGPPSNPAWRAASSVWRAQ